MLAKILLTILALLLSMFGSGFTIYIIAWQTLDASKIGELLQIVFLIIGLAMLIVAIGLIWQDKLKQGIAVAVFVFPVSLALSQLLLPILKSFH